MRGPLEKQVGGVCQLPGTLPFFDGPECVKYLSKVLAEFGVRLLR